MAFHMGLLIKIGGSERVSEKVSSGTRVAMVSVPLFSTACVLVGKEVAAAADKVSSYLRSGLICSRESG